MKHFNSILALLTLTASNNEASARRDRTARKRTQQVPFARNPTAAPSYNPTNWPTFYPTTVAQKTPRPTRRPNKRPPRDDVVPPPLDQNSLQIPNDDQTLKQNGLVIATDDIINLPPGTEEAFIGVLENDTGSNLIVRSITKDADFGSCVISISLIEVVYSPASPAFFGSDECEYEVCDDEEECDTAILRIVVKEDATSDPTSFVTRPAPTPFPTVDAGTSQTLSPTEVIGRDPTRRPITPFPTEVDVVTEIPTAATAITSSADMSVPLSSDQSVDGYIEYFKSSSHSKDSHSRSKRSGSGSGSGWSGSGSGKSGKSSSSSSTSSSSSSSSKHSRRSGSWDESHSSRSSSRTNRSSSGSRSGSGWSGSGSGSSSSSSSSSKSGKSGGGKSGKSGGGKSGKSGGRTRNLRH